MSEESVSPEINAASRANKRRLRCPVDGCPWYGGEWEDTNPVTDRFALSRHRSIYEQHYILEHMAAPVTEVWSQSLCGVGWFTDPIYSHLPSEPS